VQRHGFQKISPRRPGGSFDSAARNYKLQKFTWAKWLVLFVGHVGSGENRSAGIQRIRRGRLRVVVGAYANGRPRPRPSTRSGSLPDNRELAWKQSPTDGV